MIFDFVFLASSGLHSGTTRGTAGSRRKAEELSITVQPSPARIGANSIEVEPPAARSAKSGLTLATLSAVSSIM